MAMPVRIRNAAKLDALLDTLTEPQKATLLAIAENRTWAVKFMSAEALRRRGLVQRDTSYIVKRTYADERGEHVQWVDRRNPYPQHDWWLTPDGGSLAGTLSRQKSLQVAKTLSSEVTKVFGQ